MSVLENEKTGLWSSLNCEATINQKHWRKNRGSLCLISYLERSMKKKKNRQNGRFLWT